ncbi:glycolate oxidase subunit GlcE [Marinobacter halodurans]|uniref:Glycolate oxidase subunit GlcE n=1 Tax=Marinobacter halodurans TaxID=2528979 RepID=A0ABY1ZGY7_9GAMM|nr:glycolate oxidase subunit GlcE [Marinobacter halodurans]TBW49246.1 glycolate oxidase subunit GlcE [Marinobacter halodurans]
MADKTQALQQQVYAALAEERKLSIVGGGSKAFMGRQTDVETTPLNLSEHTGIVDYQPVELVLTVRAGTPLKEIDAALAEHNQCLSFEPPHFSARSTIGGTLACNQSGPGRPWTYSVRDQVLGLRLINGRAEHLHFGGQVMKNVAGYDVSRLQAGAMGCLGVITEISLKVMPRPASSLTLVLAMGLDDAIPYMNRRAGEPKPLTGACWFDGKLYLRLAGAQSAVEATAHYWDGDVLEDAGNVWAALRDQRLDFFAGDTPLWRFSVNSTAANPPLDGNWLVDWGGAQRWYRGVGTMADMEPLAEAAGGQVSLFRGGDRSGEVMHSQAQPMQQIQQRLKQAFDPDGVFNPGRLYSWL